MQVAYLRDFLRRFRSKAPAKEEPEGNPVFAPMPRIEVINLDTRSVILTDGTLLPIVEMVDEFGDETDEPEEAMAIVAGREESFFMSIEIDGELPTFH